ncbi:hypothetical protein Barb7_03098 [Bacteroidales bacterium Barb7]|nr:hypothetical protein Barb7_03098 [Bacteroidales bacterium Barb7]
MDRLKYIRFIFLHPSQLGSREIARRIKQVRKGFFFSYSPESIIAIMYGTAVAPYNRRAQHPLLLVHRHQTVHLIGYADCLYFRSFLIRLTKGTLNSQLQMIPPVFRILFRPTGSRSHDNRFFFGVKIRTEYLSRLLIHNGSLNRGTAYITP